MTANQPETDQAVRVTRQMWIRYEPLHAVLYFSPEARAVLEERGARGFWRGYFSTRAAPLGPVGPAPVVAAFFGFAPPMVARALPEVWTRISPERALAARVDAAVAGLERLLADQDPAAVAEAADLLERVTGGLDWAGRVLGAANAALPRPERPLARLWHAATVLREYRGDAHVAALVTAGVSGCESLVWRAALDIPREYLQPNRGWTDEQWQAARDRLVERGWLGPDGEPTDRGRAHHDAVEAATDVGSAAPWRALTPEQARHLAHLLDPLARACGAGMPYPNPIGLPAPAA